MTHPKEKAEEIVDKFKPLVTTWDCYNDEPLGYDYILEDAKQCALVAVGEILDIVSSDESAIIVELQFWQQVKQEIEKL